MVLLQVVAIREGEKHVPTWSNERNCGAMLIGKGNTLS